jgi:hypothetical protein
MNMGSSEKIRMIEEHVGGPLAELGFSISRKNSLDIYFSRTIDGVRQDIQVVLHRYADKVCARYGTSRRIDLTMPKRRVREFMARECPWHRPEDLEWISFEGDEGLPEALDRLVFVIKGADLEILGEMMKSAPAKTAESDEDKSAALPGNHLCTAAKPKRRRDTRKKSCIGFSRDERTALMLATAGQSLFAHGFQFDAWDDFSDWWFSRTVEVCPDNAPVCTAKQTVKIVETPGDGPLGIRLISNVPSTKDALKTMARRGSVLEAAKRDHPESLNGYWFRYEDDASYREALEKIADVLAKHALPMLDAECECRPQRLF